MSDYTTGGVGHAIELIVVCWYSIILFEIPASMSMVSYIPMGTGGKNGWLDRCWLSRRVSYDDMPLAAPHRNGDAIESKVSMCWSMRREGSATEAVSTASHAAFYNTAPPMNASWRTRDLPLRRHVRYLRQPEKRRASGRLGPMAEPSIAGKVASRND